MELVAAVVVAILFGFGAYLSLTRNVIRVILGSGMFAYGTNIMILSSGLLKRGGAPVLVEGRVDYVDPVPQALILTAIVINFAVTAFMFVLAYRTFQENGTDNLDELRGVEHE